MYRFTTLFSPQTKRGLKVNNENTPDLSARINSPASMSRLATRYLIEGYKLYYENVNVFSSKHSNGTLGHAKNYWFKVTLLVKTKVKGKNICTPPSSNRVRVHNVGWAGVTYASVSAQDITQKGVTSQLLLLGKFEYGGGPIFKVVLEC